MTIRQPADPLVSLADEAQALLSREGEHLEAVRAWLQQMLTSWADAGTNDTVAAMEASARQLTEQRRRFRTLLARGLGLPPAEGRLSLLIERLPLSRQAALNTARTHTLWLVRQVSQLMRLARMQSNDLASCLNGILQGGNGSAGVVERYDVRGLMANSSRATLLNDRC